MATDATSVPTRVPLLDLKLQYRRVRNEVREAVDKVLESQHFILGPEVESLEREVAAYCHCAYGVGVSSGTDALLVALMAMELQPGDEVITTPFTFFATAGAVARLGGKPVFVDIDPYTFNIDPKQIEAAVTHRTRAIIPVHLYGQMAEMDSVMELAASRGLYVIEDAAQAIGAEYRSRRAGSIGHLGCLSFFPSKNLGAAGDAGLVVTNDERLADRVRLLRTHGFRPKYYNHAVGGNFRLDAIQAAVLRVKLRYLDEWTRARQRNADTYRRLFAEGGLACDKLPADGRGGGVVLPQEFDGGRHVYNQFVVRVNERDRLREQLNASAVGTEIYYPVPLHRQQCFSAIVAEDLALPESERAANETLALPIYPELEEEQIAFVVQQIQGGMA